MEIKISAKAFAEFVAGGPAKRSSTVRKLLKPTSPEASIPSGYYKSAIAIIRAYHDCNNDSSFVAEQLRLLFSEAGQADTSQARAKRLSNITAVERYMKVFSDKRWRIISCPRIHYTSSDVRISGIPDLAIQDANRLRLVKLGVRKQKETEQMVRIMLRVIYQAASMKFAITAEDISYFDVSNGESISGERSDSTLAATIDNGCVILQQMVLEKSL